MYEKYDGECTNVVQSVPVSVRPASLKIALEANILSEEGESLLSD